jgi:hypothetical protein
MGSLGSKQKFKDSESLTNEVPPLELVLYGARGSGRNSVFYRLVTGTSLTRVGDYLTYIGAGGRRVPWLNMHAAQMKLKGYTYKFGIWNHFAPLDRTISCMVYSVDSSDRSTIDRAREPLDHMFKVRENLKGVPLLILANKQDIKGAMTPEEVEDALHLHNIKDRLYHVVGCSAMSGEGLTEGLEWFVKYRDTAKNRKYMEGPVKETLEDGKEVLKSGHSWLSSFFSRQTVKT